MAKKIFKIKPDDDKQLEDFLINGLPKCVEVLEDGGVIVFPTETLYGLGVDIGNEKAIDRLMDLKGRPKDMPIAIAVADIDQVKPLAEISELGMRILSNCLPKPITVLLKAKESVEKKLLGGSDKIGFRFPDHKITLAITKGFGPITATSANIHGGPNPVSIDKVIEQFGDNVDIYIDTGRCQLGEPSTVIDTTGDTIKIIRHGACSGSELEECL
jgi:L-threonylcarbamoyladenylate synthase